MQFAVLARGVVHQLVLLGAAVRRPCEGVPGCRARWGAPGERLRVNQHCLYTQVICQRCPGYHVAVGIACVSKVITHPESDVGACLRVGRRQHLRAPLQLFSIVLDPAFIIWYEVHHFYSMKFITFSTKFIIFSGSPVSRQPHHRCCTRHAHPSSTGCPMVSTGS